MPKSVFAQVACGALGVTALASAPSNFAVAHETHKVECNETSINAMNADIQAMEEGEAKSTAVEEMKKAKEMMANNVMDACVAHMHSAMEEIEK